MSDSRLLDREQQNLSHVIRAGVEQAKNRIRERVCEQAQIIAEEEVGKLLSDMNFDLNINRNMSMGGVDLHVSLVVKMRGKSGEEQTEI